MRLFSVSDVLDRINYLNSTINDNEIVILECNYNTMKELEDVYFDVHNLISNDELDDFEFDIYIYDLDTNDYYDEDKY